MNLSQIVILEFAQIISAIVPIVIILISLRAIYVQSEREQSTDVFLIILLVSIFNSLLYGIDRTQEAYMLMVYARDLLVYGVFGAFCLAVVKKKKLTSITS